MEKSYKRHFIHDEELENRNMDNGDKEQLRRDIELNKLYLASQGCGIHKTALLRLNIAKELLIAMIQSKRIATNIDLVDDAISLTGLLLQEIEK